MLNIGNLVPASYMKFGEEYPDLFKFYTVVPTRSTESSTAANYRRPVLYTSLNSGIGWKYESVSSDLYWANYGGNFYFNASKYHLEAWAHKSTNSSYGAYKASCGSTDTLTGIKLDKQSWTTSSVVAYNTANQPNREICKCLNSSRYYCIKEGGGYVYNNDPWNTANWTGLSIPSGTTLSDDGGFCHMCVNTEKEHEALVFLTTNDSNKYLRFYLFNTNDGNFGTNYTTTIMDNVHKQANFKYCSIGFLPGIGYLIFYTYGSETQWYVKRLITHDLSTGEMLPYNQYIMDYIAVGTSGIVQSGSHGWYCPWTKEYYFVPNANQVWSTKDGRNWTQAGVNTPASATTLCRKFMTDGQNMVIATSASAFYYSRDKGQTWSSGTALSSPNGFNTNKSNDTIVLPFKCKNNIGINKGNVTLGYWLNASGQPEASAQNFYTNDYIPIDASTSYVFYGRKKANNWITRNNRICFYDSNKTYISQTESNSWVSKGSGNYMPCVVTSPSNAAYIRISCRIDDTTVDQTLVDSCKWYFAKEEDFEVMTKYGDIVMN